MPGTPQANAAAYALATNAHTNDWLGEFTANYSKTWAERHNFSGVAGYSLQKNTYDRLGVKATGYEGDHITEVTGHGADPNNLQLYNTSKSSNMDINISKRLKAGANFSHTSNWNREIEEGRFDHGAILGALIYAPFFRCYDEIGRAHV